MLTAAHCLTLDGKSVAMPLTFHAGLSHGRNYGKSAVVDAFFSPGYNPEPAEPGQGNGQDWGIVILADDLGLDVGFLDIHVLTDADIAGILVQEGFASLEEIAYVPAEELLQIDEFDEGIVEELRNRAKDVLLTRALAKAERATGVKPDDDLLAVEGMDEDTAYALAEKGVISRENLGDLATDELLEMLPDLDEARASDLIMTARGLG